MKISFVIPAYNEEAYLGNCLESIINQIRDKSLDHEIIVVNNASTDRTEEVAKSFPGVTVIHEPQKGLTKARQAGFMVSKGDLIANLDSDTILFPGWIDKVSHEFSSNNQLVALSGPFIYYDLSKVINFLVILFYCIGYVGHIINHRVFCIGALLQGGNFVLKRTALKKIGGYNMKFDFYGEDTDIATRIQKVGKVKFTFGLPTYASGRRLAAEGLLTMAWKYGINHFWTIFRKKPYTKQYLDIRTAKK